MGKFSNMKFVYKSFVSDIGTTAPRLPVHIMKESLRCTERESLREGKTSE